MGINIGKGEFHRLDQQMLGAPVVDRVLANAEFLGDAQRHQRGNALAIRRDLVDLVSAVVGGNRAHPLGCVGGQIAGAQGAAAVATFRFDSRRALIFSTSPTGMRERAASGVRLQYEIDGEGGGSGSPVFDSEMRVVALHVARASGWLSGLAGRRLREGTAVDRILKDLHSRGVTLPAPEPPDTALA